MNKSAVGCMPATNAEKHHSNTDADLNDGGDCHKERGKLRTYIAYSMPYMTVMWLMAPLGIVQGIYAKYYGLSLTAIAAVLLIARLFDAIIDPLIGFYSDRYMQVRGSRKPFVLSGGILFVISVYFLYVPVFTVTPFYFGLWFMLVYFAWTLFEIPHISWGAELASSSVEKTQLFSIRAMGYYVGLTLFYIVPLLPFFASSEITPQVLKVNAVVAGGLMLVFLLISLRLTPDGRCADPLAKPASVAQPKLSILLKAKALWSASAELLSNRPFLIFLASHFCTSISGGMWFSLIFLYVDVYLGLGDKFAQMFILAYLVALVAIPLWSRLAMRYGKKTVLVVAVILKIISYIYTSMQSPESATTTQLVLLKIIQSLGITCMAALVPAMLSEIIDYGTLKSGAQRSGSYFGAYTFLSKAVAAIAASAGLGIAGWYGFDATAASQSGQATKGLLLAMSWIPAGITMLGLMFLMLIPIDEHRHEIVQKRLQRIRH